MPTRQITSAVGWLHAEALLVSYSCFRLIAIFPWRTKVGSCVLLFGKQAQNQARKGSDSSVCGIHCAALELGLSLTVGMSYRAWQVSEGKKKSGWLWPLGLVATGLAGAGVVILRGCWHRNMSWPVRSQDHSYQVCLSCGIKRLFDEKAFRAYGPYSYDLNRLIALDQSRQSKLQPEAEPSKRRTAS